MSDSATYLTSAQVRQRYGGRSDMWLWRLLRDDPAFPQPMRVRSVRYWKLEALVEWEKTHSEAAS